MKSNKNSDINLLQKALQHAAQVSNKIVEKLFVPATNTKNIVCLTDKFTIHINSNIDNASITIRKIPAKYALEYIKWKTNIIVTNVEDETHSVILTKLLDLQIPARTTHIELSKGDTMIIFKLLSDSIDPNTLHNDETIRNLKYEFFFLEIK